MATMYDICEETGLSTATVSRVINNSSKVSDRSRKTVLNAMDKLGFRPNQAARSLAGKKTDTIGVIFPEIDNGFYAQVLRGINDAAKAGGKHLLTAFYEDEKSLKETLWNLAQQGRTDAVIMMNSSLSVQQLDKLSNGHVPLILIGQRTDTSRLFDIIGIDNEAGSYEATTHLLNKGIKKLLLITGPNHYQDSVLRLNGAKNAIEDAGLALDDVDQIHGFFTFESGKTAMANYIERTSVIPDAVFAFNDLMALGAIEAMKESNINITQVETIGFDGSELAKFANLSTVRVPMQEIGFEAGSLAIRRMGSRPSSPTTVNLATSLVLREND
jgi:LacI family transcriptional regulator